MVDSERECPESDFLDVRPAWKALAGLAGIVASLVAGIVALSLYAVGIL